MNAVDNTIHLHELGMPKSGGKSGGFKTADHSRDPCWDIQSLS